MGIAPGGFTVHVLQLLAFMKQKSYCLKLPPILIEIKDLTTSAFLKDEGRPYGSPVLSKNKVQRHKRFDLWGDPVSHLVIKFWQ